MLSEILVHMLWFLQASSWTPPPHTHLHFHHHPFWFFLYPSYTKKKKKKGDSWGDWASHVEQFILFFLSKSSVFIGSLLTPHLYAQTVSGQSHSPKGTRLACIMNTKPRLSFAFHIFITFYMLISDGPVPGLSELWLFLRSSRSHSLQCWMRNGVCVCVSVCV